jgi:periplasmic divalent cation tolerance protein
MNHHSSEAIMVLMTAADGEEAERIASMLVNGRLAACVQILPAIKSVYRWKSEVVRESEVLFLAKTTREKFADLDCAVRAIHSYETPEIIALPVTHGSEAYLKWLVDSVSSPIAGETPE